MDLAFPFIQEKKVKAGTICLLWLLTQQAGASSLSRSCDLSINAPGGGGRGPPWLGGRGPPWLGRRGPPWLGGRGPPWLGGRGHLFSSSVSGLLSWFTPVF